MEHPNHDLIALGVKQPWAELILSGIKTIEVRSLHTKVRGPIYLYTSKRPATISAAVTAARKYKIDLDQLPMGQLVGTVEIVDSQKCKVRDAAAACIPRSLVNGKVGWHLANPQRLIDPLDVRFLPYGVWFYPFKRRNSS